MKFKLTIFFLAVASLAMAQKKELRKIEKLINIGDFNEADLNEAQLIFNSIEEDMVQTKYIGKYNFYKAAILINSSPIDMKTLRTAEAAFEKSLELKYEPTYDSLDIKPIVVNSILENKFELAKSKIEQKDLLSAERLLEEVYEFDTSNYNMLYNIANLKYDLELYDEALLDYQKLYDVDFKGGKVEYYAVNKNSGNKELFQSFALRDAALKSSKYIEPTEEYSNTAVGDIVNKLVWLYKNENNLEKAKVIFSTALENYPNDESLLLVKSDIYLNLGMMEDYKKEMGGENEIDDPLVLNNLGDAASNNGNYDKAIQYYLKSIQKDGKSIYSRINLSNSFIQKGNLETTSKKEKVTLYKKAIAELEIAHEMEPKNSDILNGLIGLYGAFGNDEKVNEYKLKL